MRVFTYETPEGEFQLRESGQPRGSAKLAGVLLHGRSRTKKEMSELAEELDLPGIRWLAPAADEGMWYPNRYLDPLETNEPYLTEAVARCDQVVDEASEQGRLGRDRVFVAGFSQGACIAVEYAMRHPDRVGSIVVFTGCLMGPPDTDWAQRTTSLDGLRVFLTGSDIDEWITEEHTRMTARVLRELGADVELHVYKGRPHVVSGEEIAAAREFISRLPALRG